MRSVQPSVQPSVRRSLLGSRSGHGSRTGLFRLAGLGLTFGLLLSLLGCDDTTTTVIVPLCDPVPGNPTAIADAAPPSTDGGMLRIPGHHFWTYSSTANVPDPADPTPTPATDDVTPTPTVTPFPADYVLELTSKIVSVRVGGQDATVSSAYEHVVKPYITVTDLEGETRTADCSMCVSCLTNATYACGECESACQGCEQVVEVSLPPMTAANGTVQEDGLEVAVAVIGPSGVSPTVYAFLPLACDDGYDNDGDGAIDALDPDCLDSLWSEHPSEE